MRKSTLLIFTIIFSYLNPAFSQLVSRVDPPNWFSGFEEKEVELLVYSNDPNVNFSIEKSDKKFAKILNQEKAPLNNYYYLRICISKQPEDQLISIVAKNGITSQTIPYSIRPKQQNPKGINQSDAIYMVFPDRFSDGSPANNQVPNYFQNVQRQELKGRRGGDLTGISNHLDYIANQGYTALWLNPIVENNEKIDSYHGYATTDSYIVDPRIGNKQDLDVLTNSMNLHAMKHVWDIVYNHWGDQHLLFKQMPDSAWFHWTPSFMRTSYRAETLMDPYASKSDKNAMSNGWFDTHMPDLNQTNPHLATYLIQNSIWWVETAHIDAFRIDTYSYPDQIFMAKLNKTLKTEYPNLFIFGETWVQGSPIQAWFTQGKYLHQSYNSHLDGTTDFQLYFALSKGLNENFGWEEGFRRIELTLSHDFIYKNPENLVTFLDNHDLARIYSVLNEDLSKWEIAQAMLLTLRGIPCEYYGSEILMTGFCDPDAHVREEFPGGWTDHPTNLFDAKNRSPKQEEAFQFLSALLKYRKSNAWMTQGSLLQFVPEDNTYVYFRVSKAQHKALMCVYSLNEQPVNLKLERFKEILPAGVTGKNILSNQNILLEKEIELPAKSVQLIEFNF